MEGVLVRASLEGSAEHTCDAKHLNNEVPSLSKTRSTSPSQKMSAYLFFSHTAASRKWSNVRSLDGPIARRRKQRHLRTSASTSISPIVKQWYFSRHCHMA